jgi:hypothetical protein
MDSSPVAILPHAICAMAAIAHASRTGTRTTQVYHRWRCPRPPVGRVRERRVVRFRHGGPMRTTNAAILGAMLVTLASLTVEACDGTGAQSDVGDGAALGFFSCNMPSAGRCSIQAKAPISFLQQQEPSCVADGGTVSTSTSCSTTNLVGCCAGVAIALPDPNGSGGFVETLQTCYYAGLSDAGGAKAACESGDGTWSTMPVQP